MARVRPLELGETPPESRAQLDNQVARGHRATNMKRTLAHSPTALAALMTWYPLRDKVAAFLGDRVTTLFAHAVSAQTEPAATTTAATNLYIVLTARELNPRLRIIARASAEDAESKDPC